MLVAEDLWKVNREYDVDVFLKSYWKCLFENKNYLDKLSSEKRVRHKESF